MDNLQSSKISSNGGFTIVESLVAGILLAVAASAALTLFSASQGMFRQSREKDDAQIAIREDLAIIERLNRRFVCLEGSCDFVADTAADPDEIGYTPPYPVGTYPPGSDYNSKMQVFRDLCVVSPGSPSGLVDDYVLKVESKLQPMRAGITREISLESAGSETPVTPHAYDVIYRVTDPTTGANRVLSRSRFAPTVANWCP